MRERINRLKIGKGYFHSGCGRGFVSAPIIYLINGKAYARDKAEYELNQLFYNDFNMKNYVCVNFCKGYFFDIHYGTGNHKHKKYELK